MKSPFLSRGQAGFTLVELLVVIGIIGILGALGYSAYLRGIKMAQSSGCLSNMRQLSAAALLYAGDNNQTFPQADLPDSWDVTLQSYLGGTPHQAMAVLKCPGDPRPLVLTPGGYWQSSFARSYAISGVTGTEGVAGSSWSPTVTNRSRRTLEIASPAETILFCECYGAANTQYQAGYSWTPGGIDTSFYPPGQLSHGTRMNFSFVDGHAESLTLSQEANLWQAVRP